MTTEVDPTIGRIRENIRVIDEAIVEAVNQRLALVAEIRRHKEQIGAEFVDREVERRNLEALQYKNSGPISAEALAHLYREILALTKRESA